MLIFIPTVQNFAFRYGEIVNINMIREKKTGKSKGFAFVCYEDQRSTVLAVDNLNGTKVFPPIGVDFFLKKANSRGARIFIQTLFSMYWVSQKK